MRGTPCVHGPMTSAVRAGLPALAATRPAKLLVAPCGPYASSYQPDRLSTAAVVRWYLSRNSAQSHHGSYGGCCCHSKYQGAMRCNAVSPPRRFLRSVAMFALIQSSHPPSHTPPEYQNCMGDAKVMAGTRALRDGGLSIA